MHKMLQIVEIILCNHQLNQLEFTQLSDINFKTAKTSKHHGNTFLCCTAEFTSI